MVIVLLWLGIQPLKQMLYITFKMKSLLFSRLLPIQFEQMPRKDPNPCITMDCFAESKLEQNKNNKLWSAFS